MTLSLLNTAATYSNPSFSSNQNAVTENTSLYLRYDGDFAGANTSHVLSAGLRYVW